MNVEAKILTLADGQEVSYDRLVLALGSAPANLPIPGSDLEGIHTARKSMAAMTALREEAKAAKNVVIVGGGFIGAEFADELAQTPGVNIHLVEVMPKVLQAAFDDEFCDQMGTILSEAGVKLHLNRMVSSFNGNGRGQLGDHFRGR